MAASRSPRTIALRIARTRADRRFDDELGFFVIRACASSRIAMHGDEKVEGRRGVLTGFDELTRHRGDANPRQVTQIMLVGVPAHDRQRVEQTRQSGRTRGPAQELVERCE
jgi:hypothetical protein